MPTFTEISVEYLAKLKNDPTDVYRPWLEVGRGSITPGKDETPESIRKDMNKAAKKLGMKVKFYTDEAKPKVVVYEVLGRETARTFNIQLSTSPTQSNTGAPTDFTPFSEQTTETGGAINDNPEDFEDAQEEVSLAAMQERQEIPSFPPPVFNQPVEEPRQIPLPQNNVPASEVPQTPPAEKSVRVRRTKAQIAADEAAKNQAAQPQPAPQPEPEASPAPVAQGTAFEGFATQEHPLVAQERAQQVTISRVCPKCMTGYAMAKICPQCGSMTEEAPLNGKKQEEAGVA